MVNVKKDVRIAFIIGLLTGFFALPTVSNLGLNVPVFILPLAAAVLFAFGVWIGETLGKKILVLSQFSRFVAVGFLNTAIDFGILNILSTWSGITAGLKIGGVNIPGFIVAVINSYFWNKLWVFKDRNKKEGVMNDFLKFLTVTIIGMLLNSGIVILITTYIPPLAGISSSAWLNAAKASASIISLIWNFLGFKLIVFNR